ncbi:exodeoxyribonuclease VII large subunit [Risungbinella massiliensis]|uniref:exodeoxyribonuclease VII large subunit n=1 Tax=Risungbinella massiliensis TaxID=1329796 RepID=UPI0005CC1E08|nr:exodeoxyribonuclease VII large subunit [Risungbinella massiliensis]
MTEKRQVWSVKQLILHVTDILDQSPKLKNVWVEGEVTNFTHYASGHMYFTLKDENSKIRCVMFSRYNRLLLFHPKNGDRVTIRGEMELYERDGLLQLKAVEMRKSGMGDLYSRFLQLKEKLEQEGIFSREKRPLPEHPRTIGVITSKHGAAVRDIITTVRRRSPHVGILLFPVAVQGISASREVAYAIEQMNERTDLDLLIVGRGGGSLEELWAFNEEMVVRAIAKSRIPIISAVGHETDTTLSDYVADVRAATPTAAAELAVPDGLALEDQLARLESRLKRAVEQKWSRDSERLRSLWERPVFQQPSARVDPYHQRLDFLVHRLERHKHHRVNTLATKVDNLFIRLTRQHPHLHMVVLHDKIEELSRRLVRVSLEQQKKRKERLVRSIAHLDALSPLKVMQRGYSLVYRYSTEQLIKSISEVQPGDLLKIKLSDGRLKCQIWGVEEKSDEGSTK